MIGAQQCHTHSLRHHTDAQQCTHLCPSSAPTCAKPSSVTTCAHQCHPPVPIS
ncbi:unnamed protein product, partial [Staurois parvus]